MTTPNLDPRVNHGTIAALEEAKTFANPVSVGFEKLADHLGLKTELARSALPVALAQIQCLDRKQQDYGPGNLIEFGAQGVLVRLSDKRSRIVNLRKRTEASGTTVALNESESDSWLDLSNYALIGYLMVQKIWPKREEPDQFGSSR